mmetsp:Transcript_40497/g.95118  ORF Transcript_40497/g.95118 Transcript_40497/m.95118 type:complete len:400 (-) Transcript_40497:590-1789(-)
MYSDAPPHHLAHLLHLGQVRVRRRQPPRRAGGEDMTRRRLLLGVQVQGAQLVGDLLALLFGEGENHGGGEQLPVQEFDQGGPVLFVAGLLPGRRVGAGGDATGGRFLSLLGGVLGRLLGQSLQGLGGLGVSCGLELTPALQDLVQLGSCPEEVAQRDGTVVGPDDVDRLSFGPADPVGELHGVGRGRREEDHVDVVGQHDDDLLPDHPTLGIVDVVHLVEDDPLDVPDQVGPPIEHASQYLRGDDEHGGVLHVDLNVSRDQSYGRGPEGFAELPILLVAQRLDGGRVHRPGAVASTHGHGVFRANGLSGGGVGGHEDGFGAGDAHHGLALEFVQGEGVGHGRVGDGGLVGGEERDGGGVGVGAGGGTGGKKGVAGGFLGAGGRFGGEEEVQGVRYLRGL